MRLLDDPALFAPFAPYFHPVIGLLSTPIECYLRRIHWACLNRAPSPAADDDGRPASPETDWMTGTRNRGTGPATPPPGQMTEAEFRSLYERLRGPARWGPDDRRGALNYITPAEVLAASAEVRLGRTVSL